MLLPRDQALLDAVVAHGMSAPAAGRLMRMTPRQVRRRVHALCNMMADPQFRRVMRLLPRLKPLEARMAMMHYCQGVPKCRIAQLLKRSERSVYRALDHINGKLEVYTLRYHFRQDSF
jgi:DNA-directed RNA polymerase specialized sigma24 family protein